MNLHSVAILDSHLITGKFSGGGLINARTLLTMFPLKYSVLYLPKSDVYYAITENPELLENVKQIEKIGFKVSNTFKELWASDKRESFRVYRRKLLSGYFSEIKTIDFVYDNDFYATLFPFPGINPDILEMCSISDVIKFGITLRGYSLINLGNNIKILKLILKNDVSSLLDSETLKRYVSFLIHPLFDRRINQRVSSCGALQFIAVVNNCLATQNSEMSENKNKFRFLFPSDVSQFGSKKRMQPKKDRNDIFFYSRLVPEKGIFEIPKILMKIKYLGHDMNLNVAGNFIYRRDEQVFRRLLIKYGVKEHVNMMGFISEDDLRDVLSSSKVLMYPSHSDSFSISILNSLHLKTKVVAYDLPALKDVYGNIPAVRFVKEYDAEAMALAISGILKEDERTYFDSFDNAQTANFLETTESSDKLFEAISKLIDEALSGSAIDY